MSAQKVRFGLAVFFAIMAVILFSREWLWPEMAAKFRTANLTLGAWFALVMAGVNLSRWYLNWSDPRQQAMAPNPLSVRRPAEPYVPNPELNFLQVPDAEQPPAGTKESP